MRKLTVTLVWLLIIAVGTAGFEGYLRWVARARPTMKARVANYEKSWQAALEDVAAVPPPTADEVAATVPLAEQEKLRQKLAEVDHRYQPDYFQRADRAFDDLERQFRGKWKDALDTCADTPAVADIVGRVHKYHQEKLEKRLADVDDVLRKKHPRTRLALDSFSGYCVFRSPEFCAKLAAQDVKLHLVDDGADYKKRIKTLQSGETPLALFTLDALINNSALFESPPGSVVLVVDETRGADAMVSYESALPTIDAMNRPDLKIVLTPDSPSETLARLVRSRFKLPRAPEECFVPVKDAEEVYASFRAANPREPRAFVLWEPYVSKLLRQYPQAKVLIDSSKFSGYIVDVLVVEKNYLHKNREEVEAVVRAYLEAAALQKDMVRLVQDDSQALAAAKKLPEALTAAEAGKVVRGIWWKSTTENYGHFGLLPAGEGTPLQPLEEMTRNIATVLIKTRAISRKVEPQTLLDKEVCSRLLAAHFDPGSASPGQQPLPVDRPADWAKLAPVGTLDLQPVAFERLSSTIPAESEPFLEELAHTLKTSRYYLEIRGHARGTTPEDKELAQQRAAEVARWLRDNGGVDAERLRAVGGDSPADDKSLVSFVLLEPPR
jgi:flagellar motor protein MotB